MCHNPHLTDVCNKVHSIDVCCKVLPVPIYLSIYFLNVVVKQEILITGDILSCYVQHAELPGLQLLVERRR